MARPGANSERGGVVRECILLNGLTNIARLMAAAASPRDTSQIQITRDNDWYFLVVALSVDRNFIQLGMAQLVVTAAL